MMSAGSVSPGPARRLWPALSHARHRLPPPQGLDAFGSWLEGRVVRRAIRADRTQRAEHILELSELMQSFSEAALDERIEGIRNDVRLDPTSRETVDRAFAIIREVIRRTLGLGLYPEQIIGGLIMAEGAGAEMATGEGKTVTAILPAALLGWTGRGVHILTVNDYLANRDAEITLPAYRRLGLHVGVITESTPNAQRRQAYDADLTYAADKQVIFDFLRDSLLQPGVPSLSGVLLRELSGEGVEPWTERIVHRGFHAAIVDEADSVLIDEAATPAIIAAEELGEGSGEDPTGTHHKVAASIAAKLEVDRHYKVDAKLRHVELTPEGRACLAELTGEMPAFWRGPRRREEIVRTALIAKEIQVLGDDYIVRDGKVEIIDRSTGRVLEGRQWQMGLHQAVEAKEGLEPTKARRTSTRISYARFFQQYQHLCGMSGTLHEVADELWSTYRLAVVRVPTHRPVIRKELPDVVCPDEGAKLQAVVDRVCEIHSTGQPVLVGTRSVLTSETLGSLLAQRGVECQILNAEREEQEASIVARAGQRGAVTVATNMAGRGTDIKLDQESKALGGLVVIGTERHTERRVDRQLFGRSGRQGDPGLAQMYVCCEDQLILSSGLPPLIWLAKKTHFGPFASLLWKQAQWLASKRAVSHRITTARADSWHEMAMNTAKS
ncbi:MAG TPA: prepilin peptidase [Phycisphaerales bacterium]|nr:prepilin peptidase [Phycisphaerales bacterium]